MCVQVRLNVCTAPSSPRCVADPLYGNTTHAVGNERGHLVEVTRCIEEGGAASYPGHPASSFRNRSLAVKQGDQLRVDGWYWVGDEDARLGAMPAGPHLGVMAYWYGVFADL